MVGDIGALPFPDETFDLVCAFDIVEHVEDDEQVFRELARVANERRAGVADLGLPAARLKDLVLLVEAGKVARQAASREVLPRMLAGKEASAVVEAMGLAQVDDAGALREAVRAAVAASPKAAADFRAGKKQAFGALMGAVMRQTKGKANPKVVEDLLKEVVHVRGAGDVRAKGGLAVVAPLAAAGRRLDQGP